MRKLLFAILSFTVFPVLAELCTPDGAVLTLKPGKVAIIDGKETCVSGSCMTFDTWDLLTGRFIRAIPIVPTSNVPLGGGGLDIA